jgi:hypothetical protein
MAAFLYRCPNTGQHVQGWSAEEVPADEGTYETVSCIACQQVHLVNFDIKRRPSARLDHFVAG